jgi:hypothetical protein
MSTGSETFESVELDSGGGSETCEIELFGAGELSIG